MEQNIMTLSKDTLNLVCKELDLTDILNLKSTCKHFFIKLLKYKASDVDCGNKITNLNHSISAIHFAERLKKYYLLPINKKLAHSILDRLASKPNYIYGIDNFHEFFPYWRKLKKLTIKPIFQLMLQYLHVSCNVEYKDGNNDLYYAVPDTNLYDEFEILEERVNCLVKCQNDFRAEYVYDCFSPELLEAFSNLGIGFRVKKCKNSTDT